MDLQPIVFASDEPGPRLLITAGVHGDEYEPIVAVRSLAEWLEGRLLRGTATLIPIVNEGAYRRASRVGEDGLDLARTCPGNLDGSETEQLAAALSEKIRGADFYIDLHTGGRNLEILPLVGYMLHEDDDVLQWQRQLAEAFNLPIIWGTTPQLEGRSLSVARDARVPAIYAEHGGGGTYRKEVASDYFDGCLNVMNLLGMVRYDATPARVQHRVEDSRIGSGHLQVRHPSPVDGLFIPAVCLAQPINCGELLGETLDVISGERHSVLAECDGIVLMLHASPRVRLGSGLAVILETESDIGLNHPRRG